MSRVPPTSQNDDDRDRKEIRTLQRRMRRQLIDAGFEPESVAAAMSTGDLTKLVHLGLANDDLPPSGPLDKM